MRTEAYCTAFNIFDVVKPDHSNIWLYCGRTFDDNGYPPFAVRLDRRPKLWDVNVTAFSGFTVVLAAALVLLVGTAGA